MSLSHPTQPLGAVLKLTLHGLRRDALLFGESQSRVILSVSPGRVDEVLAIARDLDVPAEAIGRVGGDRLVIEVEGDQRVAGCRIDVDVKTLQDRWANSLQRALEEGKEQ